MKKILLLLFLIFLNYTQQSNANDIDKNTPIIKQLDKQYLNLIDKNGKITNIKEFNKNGRVLVFEDEDKIGNYLFIYKKYSAQNKKYFLDGTYVDSVFDFLGGRYCVDACDDQLIATIDLDSFTYKNMYMRNLSDQDWLLFDDWIKDRNNKKTQIDFIDIIFDVLGFSFYNSKKEQQIKKLLNI